jgi:hypothetical protein
MAERTRLTLDMDPALHRKLKMLAARRGITMRELCLWAIEKYALTAPDGRIVIPLDPDEVLRELWDNEDDAVYDNL